MASYDIGMEETIAWIKDNVSQGGTALDVGACDGKWSDWLRGYLKMDAIEIFVPYIINNKLDTKYENVFTGDISDFMYDHYDLIIFGDVIEHLTVERAQAVIEYAKKHCDNIVVAIPLLYSQEPYDGNEHERHIQDDLTEAIFDERYPGFHEIVHPAWNYVYYYWKKE